MRVPFALPAAGSRPFDVAGFGLNSLDLVTVVAEYPARNSKQRIERFARLPGGQIATATAACARLGWKALYIGSFGGDEFGRLSHDSLTSEGVNTDYAWTVESATNQFAVVLVDARTGERTVLWDRHPGLAATPDMIPREPIAAARVLIVDCHQTAAAAQAARYAREAGTITIVDVERVRPGIHELLREIDAIIAAEEFPAALTGYADPGRALEAMAGEFGAPLVAVTLGERGSLARCSGREIRTLAFHVPCVDSTGAGDAFRGGLAAGLLRAPGGDIEDALAYANAVAALNCRALGARGGLPLPEEVERLLIR